MEDPMLLLPLTKTCCEEVVDSFRILGMGLQHAEAKPRRISDNWRSREQENHVV